MDCLHYRNSHILEKKKLKTLNLENI